jgi:O-antigen/teichoic acid export membrane protein
VAAIAGPAAVAPFALLARLFNFTTMPQQSWLESIWPALTDAYARGDTAWARVAIRRTLLVVAGGAVLPLVLSPWWAPPLLSWWTQLPGTAFPPELLRAMSLSLAASLMLAPVSVWLNARGRPHGQSLYGTIAIVILIVTLPRAVAVGGAAAAPLVTLAVTAFLLVPAMVIDLAITQRLVLRSR